MGKIRSTANDDERVHHQVPAEADMALQNWARWAAPRHGCARRVNPSFRFVKPSAEWEALGDAGAPSGFAAPVDAEAAWAAERVICNPAFWPPARTLLMQHYLYRQDQRATCRLLGVHRDAYDYELWRAGCMFWNLYQQRVGG